MSDEVSPKYDKDGAVRWYTKGHDGYFMKNFVGHDSRILNIKDWLDEFVPKNGKILDVGAGDMTMSQLCPNYDWTGIDLDASKDPRVKKHDVSITPYAGIKGESFDGVLCSEVLEHLFEPHKVIQEFARVLKPGGHVLITVPNFDNIDNVIANHRLMVFDPTKFWTLEHIRWYTKDSMAKLIIDAGFELVDIIGNSPCFSSVMVENTKRTVSFLKYKYGLDLNQAQADQLFGRIFGAFTTFCSGALVLVFWGGRNEFRSFGIIIKSIDGARSSSVSLSYL